MQTPPRDPAIFEVRSAEAFRPSPMALKEFGTPLSHEG